MSRRGLVDPHGANATIIPVLILCGLAALTLLLIFTDTGQELTPRHDGDSVGMLGTSAVVGLLCLRVALGPKPRPWRRVLRAVGWSALVAFLCCPVTGVALARLHEIADFAGGPVTEGERQLPIEVAQVRHGRGVSYDVWLRDYAALLTVERQDYLAAFGTAERVRPSGWCIFAVVQTSGRASRIMARHGMALPAGSLRRCNF